MVGKGFSAKIIFRYILTTLRPKRAKVVSLTTCKGRRGVKDFSLSMLCDIVVLIYTLPLLYVKRAKKDATKISSAFCF